MHLLLLLGTPFAMSSINSPRELLKNIPITCCFRSLEAKDDYDEAPILLPKIAINR